MSDWRDTNGRRNILDWLECRRLLAGSVSGTVYNDLNGNGAWDANEAPAEGAFVFVDANSNGLYDTGERLTTTQSAGDYGFQDLPSGAQLAARVAPVNGWIQSSYAVGLWLHDGEDLFEQNLGATNSCRIDGYVFHDANANGTIDNGESWSLLYDQNLGDWTIYLDLNGNSALDGDEPSVVTSGSYSFGGLQLGSYTVRAVPPSPFILSAPASGSYAVTFTELGTAWSLRFGAYREMAGVGSISGKVFNDLNGSRTADPGEPPAEGFVVFLDSDHDSLLDEGEISTVTGADGVFGFEEVPAGTTTVAVQQRDGWTWTDVSMRSFTLSPGEHQDIVFCQTQSATIGGITFSDADGDGYYNNGESYKFSGVGTVYLDLNGNQLFDQGDLLAYQWEQIYRFGGVQPGTYTIRQIPRTGHRLTAGQNGFTVQVKGPGHVEGGWFGDYVAVAPTDLAISGDSVPENSSPGIVVGTLSAQDANVREPHSFALVEGTGSVDNATFSIEGEQLILKQAADYEAKSSYSIRVRVTDREGLWSERSFSIHVIDVNENVTGISLSNATVAEGAGAIEVGTLSALDPDRSDWHVFTLVNSASYPDNDMFVVVGSSLRTRTGLDYETKSSYSICLRVTDAGGTSYERPLLVHVNDVNERPTAILLSNGTVAEGAGATVVGTLLALDPDADDSQVFTLVSSVGYPDNGRFVVVGNSLRTRASLDYEAKSSYSLLLRATDAAGAWYERPFTIEVGNAAESALVATGTVGGDVIVISTSGTKAQVSVNGRIVAVRELALTDGVQIDGGSGDDSVSISDEFGCVVSVYGGAGDDTLLGGRSADYLDGGEGNDLIKGGDGSDTLYGGDGADSIYGNLGDDLIGGGLQRDSIMGGLGTDTIAGGDGPDRIWGGDGADLIRGGNGADYIEGKGKADMMYGGPKNDTILGQAGDDTIDAGEGDDWIYVHDGSAFHDFVWGGQGTDRVQGDDWDSVLECELNVLG